MARAVITHGHADHARAGHGAVLATVETLDIMGERYGAGFGQAVMCQRTFFAHSIMPEEV